MAMDLTTSYLGLSLKHPVVASASPLSVTVEAFYRIAEAGAAAIVLPSLFEEQINADANHLDRYLGYAADSFAEALSYFPEASQYRIGPEEYLERIASARALVDVPIIASLNGVSTGGWVDLARAIQQAGAQAIELNVYFIPTDTMMSGETVETMYLDVLEDVRACVTIP